jgi:hypothetical protein
LPHSIARIVLAAAAVSTAACSTSDTAARSIAFAERDSAGVHIVDNGGNASTRDSLLPLTETMRISSDDASSDTTKLLFGISAIVGDSAGRLYVTDRSQRISVYDSTGNLLRVIGRRGQGPGEFSGIWLIMPVGDSLSVYDRGLQRLTMFDANGRVASEERLEAPMFPRGREDFRVVVPEAILRDGLIVRMNLHKQYPGPGLKRDTATFRRVASFKDAVAMGPDWKTSTVPSQPVHAMTPWMWMEKDGTSYRWGPLWSASPQVRHDGRGRLYLSDGMHYRIDVYDVDGAMVRSMTRSHHPVAITKKLVDDYYSFVANVMDTVKLPGPAGVPNVKREPGASNARTMKDLEMERKAVPHEKWMPALGSMIVSWNGAVWIERPDLVDDPISYEWDHRPRPQQYWDVLGPDGRYRGTVKLPTRFSPRAATDHSIIGVSYDEDDIESIVEYSIPVNDARRAPSGTPPST